MYFKTPIVKLIFVISLFFFQLSCTPDHTVKTVNPKDSLANSEFLKETSIAIENDPNNAELYYQRSVSYYNLKYLDRAYTDIQDAIRYNEQNALYQFQKGRICYAMNKTIEAEKAYLSAIALKPDYEVAQMKLGELYYIVKKHNESLNLLNVVVAANPNRSDAYFFKGMNYKEMGDTSRAIAAFQKSLEIDAVYYDAAIQLGQILTEKGDKSALEYLNAAIRMQKTNTEGYFARGYYFQRIGMFQKALLDYRKVIDLDPSNDLAYYNVGCINYDVKQYKEAMRAFNICIEMNNRNYPAYYMRGLIHEQNGEQKEAIMNYTFVLEGDPTFTLAKNRLDVLK